MKQRTRLISFVLAFGLLGLSGACFRIEVPPCTKCTAQVCPEGLACKGGYCVAAGETIDQCLADAAVPSDVLPEGSRTDTTSLSDTPTAEPLTCADRCCVGTACLDLTPRMKSGVVLWVDRTSLGTPGSALLRWTDRSPAGNHVFAANMDSPPRVQLDNIGPIAEIDETRMVLSTKGDGLRPFGLEDFTILVLARCDERTSNGPLFSKMWVERPQKGIDLYCNHTGGGALMGLPLTPTHALARLVWEDAFAIDNGVAISPTSYAPGSLHLYGARRAGAAFQVRVDGKIEKELTVPRSINLNDDLPAFVGTLAHSGLSSSPTTTFDGGIAAVVVVSGPLDDAEVAALEAFLLATQGAGAATF